MAIHPELFDLMPSYVQWERYTGTDSVGNNTYAAARTVQCRLEPIASTMSVTSSQDSTAVAQVGVSVRIIADLTTPYFKALDRVTLPDDTQVRIVTASLYYDENGPYYQEANCENNQES